MLGFGRVLALDGRADGRGDRRRVGARGPDPVVDVLQPAAEGEADGVERKDEQVDRSGGVGVGVEPVGAQPVRLRRAGVQVDHAGVREGEGDGRVLVGAVRAALNVDVVEEGEHARRLPHHRVAARREGLPYKEGARRTWCEGKGRDEKKSRREEEQRRGAERR